MLRLAFQGGLAHKNAVPFPTAEEGAMVDFAKARRMMVDSQVRPNNVTDLRVLGAFLEVERELFVPAESRELAYLDRNVTLGAGRCILKPMVLAKLVQAAEIGSEDRVLIVGSGAGYLAAIVSRLAGSVVALESDAGLARSAAGRLAKSPSVKSVSGPLVEGFPADAPYNVILVDGGVEFVPDTLCGQLAPGGRLVCIMRDGAAGKGIIFRNSAGQISRHDLFDAAGPVLPGFARTPEFIF